MNDARINEITMNDLGKWPSFEAQSWACKVAHAVLAAQAASLVRYCPECGHVGPVPDTAIACCPDSHPADVPETFVQVIERSQKKMQIHFDEKDALLKEHERLTAETTIRATKAEERAYKLTGLILKALDVWWPLVHDVHFMSDRARNLRKELSDGIQPEGAKFDGVL